MLCPERSNDTQLVSNIEAGFKLAVFSTGNNQSSQVDVCSDSKLTAVCRVNLPRYAVTVNLPQYAVTVNLPRYAVAVNLQG